MSSQTSGQRFADYFAVCGLDTNTGLEPDQITGNALHISPLERSYKAKVLGHYPSNVEWNPFDGPAVNMLCLPQGLVFVKQSEPHDSCTHSFIITREDGSRTYGYCLTFYEAVKDEQICTAMQTLQTMHGAEITLATQRRKSRAHSPLIFADPNSSGASDISITDDLLNSSLETEITNKRTFNIKSDVLMVSKCICIIMPLPFIHACKSYLSQLYQATVCKEHRMPLPLESYIYNLLFEVPLPPPGRTMRFFCAKETITCQRPSVNELPLFDYSLKDFFSLLGVENIVQLFTCVLLEHQMLLLSKDFTSFMLVAECVTALIFPFVWQHVYVPILPASLSHFLDAPVPFIMGLYCGCEEDKKNLILPSEASLCLVDIDNCTVSCPEDLPEFPYRKELIDELNETVEKFKISLPKSSGSYHSRPVSACNSLETSREFSGDDIDVTANGSGGSRSNSPSGSRSPLLEVKRREVRRVSQPNLVAKDKPIARVKPRRVSMATRVPKSKSATSLDMSKNPRLQAIAAIAERTGIMASISAVASNLEKSASDSELQQYGDHDGMFILGDSATEISRKQQHENELNAAIREIFANRFTQLFLEYESFVIQPNQDMDQWISNREEMQNFDKAAFLSDQPAQFLPFLSPMTETQMFASFVDTKIVSNWEEVEPWLAVFDQRVANMKKKLGVVRSPSYETCMTLKNAVQVLLRRSNSVDHLATTPHSLDIPFMYKAQQSGSFQNLCAEVLREGPSGKSGRHRPINWKRRGRKQQQSEHLQLNTAQDGKKMRDKWASRLKKHLQESREKNRQSQFGDMDCESTQTAFIQKLLKECRQKTKRILVQKMGQEAVDLGHSDASVSGIEENTQIASLCDLLERIWGHGLLAKQGKSALWTHLLAFQRVCEEEEEDMSDQNSLSPMAGSRSVDAISPQKFQQVKKRASTSPEVSVALVSISPITTSLPAAASSLLADMRHVQKMTEIKTDIGHARAWTRLALEKKLLSKHLKQLLSRTDMLMQKYKYYAFLRTEEEKEQFMFHLLSLTAVDFFCFTNCFVSTAINYKVVIKSGKQLGGSTTTANAWMTLSGDLTNTGMMNLPKNENEFRFQHTNLGVLTTLRIGHDNSGYSPGWFIEQIIVKNEVTGHIYRFSCGRWLSRSIDDGSIERLLVAELLRPRCSDEDTSLAEVCRSSSQRRSPVLSKKNREKMRVPETRERVADAVNKIVKHFYKPEKERGNLTFLLCGEGGLCQALEQVFQCGFKSSRLFRNSFFIWDILEKAQQFIVADEGEIVVQPHLKGAQRTLSTIITRINNSSQTIGKDEKFQSFVCLGARDHLLHDWFEILSLCSATTNMYDPVSFFRDSSHMQFLVDILTALVEFNITLEASLLKGIA